MEEITGWIGANSNVVSAIIGAVIGAVLQPAVTEIFRWFRNRDDNHKGADLRFELKSKNRTKTGGGLWDLLIENAAYATAAAEKITVLADEIPIFEHKRFYNPGGPQLDNITLSPGDRIRLIVGYKNGLEYLVETHDILVRWTDSEGEQSIRKTFQPDF